MDIESTANAGVRRDRGGIYGISKWALRSFAYNLREEAKRYGVGVSLINPGGTFTETRKKQNKEDIHLLESKDLGILIATAFRLSRQAVIEHLDVPPLEGGYLLKKHKYDLFFAFSESREDL